MRKKKLFVLSGVLLCFLGCVSAPAQTGFLNSYSGMSNQYRLDGVRVAPGADFSSYDTLILAPVDTQFAGYDLGEEDKKNILNKLEESFRVEMSRHFKTVTTDKVPMSGGKALRLELAVTELKPTDVAKNLIYGFGVGNATGSIEGRFVDAQTGQELVAFMDRKKGSPFTKKEFDAGMKFPNWSKLRYLYLFTEIWAENAGAIVKGHKKAG